MIRFRRLISCVLALSVVSMTGCTSMKTIHPATAPEPPTFEEVKAGDTVVVHTRGGQRARFVVQQVEGDALIAPDGIRYPAREIVQLQRRSFSTGRTVALAGGIFASVVVIVMAAAVAALDSMWSGGY